jgi:hypothetical protein
MVLLLYLEGDTTVVDRRPSYSLQLGVAMRQSLTIHSKDNDKGQTIHDNEPDNVMSHLLSLILDALCSRGSSFDAMDGPLGSLCTILYMGFS